MKLPLLVPVLALICGTGICAAQTTPADEATFRKLQSDWAEARKNQDVAFLERFYATEFTVGVMNGSENTREQDISVFRTKILKPAVITDTEMVVHRYGEAALVTGVEHLEGTYAGNSGAFDLRFANTYVYRDGRWQMVRHQATPIVKP
ncbi:nuclear transport factor 2 family protein [Terriglobus sp. TAA 43]|uniref:nuclear transport factor 2 family protein n=1 Tax=Terriglobus sp. TAA 43 TaxID=278961 RepID=UPI000646AE96|nr:nuclear transport factor 2 family protein [Terriglobus sp. TAA 43]